MHHRSAGKEKENRLKKLIISYPMLNAMLCAIHIDLQWADNQYWITLIKVIGEYTKMHTRKKKEKVTAKEMAGFIRKE